jgi:hypothetical protein
MNERGYDQQPHEVDASGGADRVSGTYSQRRIEGWDVSQLIARPLGSCGGYGRVWMREGVHHDV